MTRKIAKAISLFSGGGGMDIGFKEAGFEILYAMDIDHDCCETLKMNRGGTLDKELDVVEGDIRSIDLGRLPRDASLVIGGPPCQPFSASGRRAGGAAGQLDQRGRLFEDYCRVVSYISPKAFVFENVRGFLGASHGADFAAVKAAFEELGYKVDCRILDAAGYGAPQHRERLFIVGHKLGEHFLFPRPVYGPDSPGGGPYVAVGEAISGLPLAAGEDEAARIRGGKYSHLVPLVPPGDNYLFFTAKRGCPDPVFAYRSRFSDFLYKADPGCPVRTLTASPGKYTGPLHWDNRYFTVNEYKRIQGFPDNHVFYGGVGSQIRQIGNSVCPKNAYYLALAVKDQVFGDGAGISCLAPGDVLSFDRRKSEKAKKTKALHQAVVGCGGGGSPRAFHMHSFEEAFLPLPAGQRYGHVCVIRAGEDSADIHVSIGGKDAVASMALVVSDTTCTGREIRLRVTLHGDGWCGVQAIWDAVDLWVRRSSSLCSLMDLYGHFSEPHPIFRVDSFESRSALPIFGFAGHCMDFSNCSTYFEKKRLLDMWGSAFGEDSFGGLARKLRGCRFDVRSHETNIAIPQGVYMVAYPFTLPYGRQMGKWGAGECS